MSMTETLGPGAGTAHPGQTGFPVTMSQRTVLLTMETVRAVLGTDAEAVWAMVDNGGLRWVFDISVQPAALRQLRFWTGEIVAPEQAATQTPDQVIAGILGHGESRRRGEIERQWICSAQHVMRLIKEGELDLIGPQKISRASLAAFLKRRLQ